MESKKDPRVRAFLRQAITVIAASGGLNEVKHGQLRALAENLRLTDAEWQLAWDELSAAGKRGESLSRYERAFAKVIAREFARLPDRVLSLKVENRALRLAELRFQIAEVRARQIIEAECERQQIARLSRSDAEDYVEQVVIQELEGLREPTAVQLERLFAFAKQWGVRRDAVNGFIDEAIADNVRGWQRLERTSLGWQRIAMFLLVALATVAAATAFYINARPRPSVVPIVRSDPVEPSAPVHAWWPVDAGSTSVDATSLGTAWVDRIDSAARAPAPERLLFYGELWSAALAETDTNVRRRLLHLLALFIDRDPDSQNVDRWLNDQLTTAYLESLSESRESELRRKIVCWQLLGEAAVTLRADDATRTGRCRLEILNWLDQQGLFGIGDVVDADEARTAARAFVVLDHWQRARRQMHSNLNLAAIQSEWLRELGKGAMADDVLYRTHASYVCDLVSAAPPTALAIPHEVELAIQNASPGEWVQWIHLHLDRDTDRETLDLLNRPLLLRLGDERESIPQPEIDRILLNAYLTQKSQQSPGLLEGWNRLRATVHRLSSPETASQVLDQPQQIGVWSQIANDGLLLAEALGNDLEQELPPTFGESKSTDFAAKDGQEGNAGQAPRLYQVDTSTPADHRLLEESLAVLKQFAEPLGPRQSAIENLASISKRLQDLPTSQAETLAHYYLRPLWTEEWLHAEKHFPEFTRWPRFLLALAEAIQEGLGDVDQATTIAQLACESDLQLSRDEPWRTTISRSLEARALAIWRSRFQPNADRLYRHWQRVPSVLAGSYRQRLGLHRRSRAVPPRADRRPPLFVVQEELIAEPSFQQPPIMRAGLRELLAKNNDVQATWLMADLYWRRELVRLSPWASRPQDRQRMAEVAASYESAIEANPTLGAAMVAVESHLAMLNLLVVDSLMESKILQIERFRVSMTSDDALPAAIENLLDRPPAAGSEPAEEFAAQLLRLNVNRVQEYHQLAESLVLAAENPPRRDFVIPLYLIAAFHGDERQRSSALHGLAAAARSEQERQRFLELQTLYDAYRGASESREAGSAHSESEVAALASLLALLRLQKLDEAAALWQQIESNTKEGWHSAWASSGDLEYWCSGMPLSDHDLFRILGWRAELQMTTAPTSPRESAQDWALLASGRTGQLSRLPTLCDVSEFDPRAWNWRDGTWTVPINPTR